MEEASADPQLGSWISCIQPDIFRAPQQKLTIDVACHYKRASLYSNIECVSAMAVPYLNMAHRGNRRHLRHVCKADCRLLQEPIELSVYKDKSEATIKMRTL